MDDENRIQTGGGQGGEPIGQGGDHGKASLGPVNQHRMRIERDGDRQRALAVRAGHLPGALDHAGENGLMPAVNAIEDADGDDGPGVTGGAQSRWHLLGAVPDLHCG